MILFADQDLLVVNKSAGQLVLPDRWDPTGYSLPQTLEKEFGPLFIVHRLDKDTSGVLLLARNEAAHRGVNGQFSAHEVEKTYWALVSGKPGWLETRCELALRPDGDSRHRTLIDPREGKPSSTDFRLVESGRTWALVEAKPTSGRTHQIRAHLKALGFPLWGDELYGGPVLNLSAIKRGYRSTGEEKPLLSRVGLHALRLRVTHPVTGERLTWEAPLPKDFETALKQLRKWG